MTSDHSQAGSDLDEDWGDALDPTSNTQPVPGADDEPKVNLLTGKKVRQKSSSFASVVADLDIDESACKAHMLDKDMTLAKLSSSMSEMKTMVGNNARPSVAIAKKRTGNEYRIETGETLTTGGRIYLLVIVTRIA